MVLQMTVQWEKNWEILLGWMMVLQMALQWENWGRSFVFSSGRMTALHIAYKVQWEKNRGRSFVFSSVLHIAYKVQREKNRGRAFVFLSGRTIVLHIAYKNLLPLVAIEKY